MVFNNTQTTHPLHGYSVNRMLGAEKPPSWRFLHFYQLYYFGNFTHQPFGFGQRRQNILVMHNIFKA